MDAPRRAVVLLSLGFFVDHRRVVVESRVPTVWVVECKVSVRRAFVEVSKHYPEKELFKKVLSRLQAASAAVAGATAQEGCDLRSWGWGETRQRGDNARF